MAIILRHFYMRCFASRFYTLTAVWHDLKMDKQIFGIFRLYRVDQRNLKAEDESNLSFRHKKIGLFYSSKKTTTKSSINH